MVEDYYRETYCAKVLIHSLCFHIGGGHLRNEKSLSHLRISNGDEDGLLIVQKSLRL